MGVAIDCRSIGLRFKSGTPLTFHMTMRKIAMFEVSNSFGTYHYNIKSEKT
ncbi:hypothetical protein H8356DRAFT_1354166 [Neocallimastix lanati (nom. inval.)]|nr:hypothetical protein H8356DRAFT_1354166 [Neocallimastix sp. JGI-2020a]